MERTIRNTIAMLIVSAGLLSPAVSSANPFEYNQFYFIHAKNSDKCMHVHGGCSDSGDNISQWTCDESKYNTQWELEPVYSWNDTWVYIKARNSGLCLSVAKSYGDKANITQQPCSYSDYTTHWKIEESSNKDGYYRIVSRYSDKCAHVHGGGSNNGASITQYRCLDLPNILWWFENVS